MNYWLVKSEPNFYYWGDLVAKGENIWDGARNYQLGNFFLELKISVSVYFYRSHRAILGSSEVTQEVFPDSQDCAWVAVLIRAKGKLKNPIPFSQLELEHLFSQMLIMKQIRLSGMAFNNLDFKTI
jgi:predicted RNA-binding protein with PUA-like domain